MRFFFLSSLLLFSVTSFAYLPQDFTNKYQFILFYRSSCPYCQRFDPVLKKYSEDNGIKVIAFTLDGISLPSFPNSIPVSRKVIEEYFGDNEISVPTLFLLNIANLHAYPVSRGALSYYDLVSRMNELIPKVLSFERTQHV